MSELDKDDSIVRHVAVARRFFFGKMTVDDRCLPKKWSRPRCRRRVLLTILAWPRAVVYMIILHVWKSYLQSPVTELKPLSQEPLSHLALLLTGCSDFGAAPWLTHRAPTRPQLTLPRHVLEAQW